MDWKSIVLNKRMKFFLYITLISNCLFPNWAYPYDAQDILEPFHLLSFLYSKHHNLQPKRVDPNIAYSILGILAAKDEMSDLSVSLLIYLCSMKEDTQHAYEHDPYLQLLLEYVHFQNRIPVLTNPDNDAEYPLEEQNNDILSPKLDGNLNCLLNGNSCGNLTYNKTKTFIETKVTAMKLQGFKL